MWKNDGLKIKENILRKLIKLKKRFTVSVNSEYDANCGRIMMKIVKMRRWRIY